MGGCRGGGGAAKAALMLGASVAVLLAALGGAAAGTTAKNARKPAPARSISAEPDWKSLLASAAGQFGRSFAFDPHPAFARAGQDPSFAKEFVQAFQPRSQLSPVAPMHALSATAGKESVQSAAIFNTWDWVFPPRTAPANASSPFAFAFDRAEMGNRWSTDQRREFGANWGNAAVGQAEALNRDISPTLAGIRGRGVTVAVIDAGIDARFNDPQDASKGFAYVNPEFAGRLDIRSRTPFADGTFSLTLTDGDSSHGTHVAGTIGAALDNSGTLGIAPGANILALRGLGEGDVVASLNYAASQSDVRIINNSYGFTPSPGDSTWFTPNLDRNWQAVRANLAAGKLLVYSAGNSFQSAPLQAVNPIGAALFPYIRPANANTGVYNDGGANYDFSYANSASPGYIIVVANLTPSFTISPFSNRCGVAAAWCISAPGSQILSPVTVGTGIAGDIGPDITRSYNFKSGTSMAAPHVSGVLAVLFEAFPTYSPRDLVRLIFATAQDLGDPGVDRIYGHGLVRLDLALAAGPNIADIPDTFVRNLPAGQTETWAAPINTSRALNVQAASEVPQTIGGAAPHGGLVIAGVSSFGGGVTVSSGDLVVDGTLIAPAITVAAGARLLGDGDITGNVTVNGTLKPGTGPGELLVTGNVRMNAGSILQIDADGMGDQGGPGSHSVLLVSGAGNVFTAGGTLRVSLRGEEEGADNTFTPIIGDRMKVVSASSGASVTGRFANLATTTDATGDNGLPAGTRLDVIYRADAVTLAVDPLSFANLNSFGVNLNQRQSGIGSVLDGVRNANGGNISGAAADVFDAVAGLGPQQLGNAFQQLSGSGHQVQVQSALAAGQTFSGLIGERSDALRTGAAAANTGAPALAYASQNGTFAASQPPAFAKAAATAGLPPLQYGLWGKAFGQISRLGGDGVAGAARTTTGGVIFGADAPLSADFTVGAAVAYSRGRTKSADIKGDTTSYIGALYGSYTLGPLEADASVGIARSDFTANRALVFGAVNTTAAARSRGTGVVANAEAGYRLRFINATPLWLKPFAGLSYNSLSRSAFNESGAGNLGLGFASQSFDTLSGRVGFGFGATFATDGGMTWLAEGKLAYSRDLTTANSYQASLIGQSVKLAALAPGRDALLAKAQLTAVLSEHLQGFAAYSGEVRANLVSHRVEGGMRLTW